MKSPFMRAITSSLISFGHTASHSPMLVQLPKSSCLACATMVMARWARYGCPCGSRPRWAILAPVNSAAAALGHMATQAPQPMQAAAAPPQGGGFLGGPEGVAACVVARAGRGRERPRRHGAAQRAGAGLATGGCLWLKEAAPQGSRAPARAGAAPR